MPNYSNAFIQITNIVDRKIYPSIRKAQTDTLNQMLDKLNEFITVNVYDVQGIKSIEPLPYDRSEILYELWEVTKPHITKGTVTSSISINEDNFWYAIESWTHYSQQFNEALEPQDYVNIIENGVSSQHSIFGEMEARPFWNDFIKWCDEHYESMFMTNLYKYLH